MPTCDTAVGVSLLMYMFTITSMNQTISIDKSISSNEHELVLSSMNFNTLTGQRLQSLQMDIVKLVCNVTCKFQSCRQLSPTQIETSPYCGDNCCGSCSNGQSYCAPCHHDTRRDTDYCTDEDSASSACGTSTTTDHSDSTFFVSDEEDKVDDSNFLYSDIIDNNNANVFNNLGTSVCQENVDCVTESEDDNSVKEVYPDFSKDKSWMIQLSVQMLTTWYVQEGG